MSRAVWNRLSGFFSRQRSMMRPMPRGRPGFSSDTRGGVSLRIELIVEIVVSP